ncbi:hypothetical protein Tco_1458249 [Tanacetum coccineum]
MSSTRASISKASKRPKINIIPLKQLFVDLTHDDTKTSSPTLQLSSPSAPNAPSKTPLTKDTSSSSIDYIPKSPTLSTSFSPNGHLNSPTSPPPRVAPPPPTQENASMDITLTLSLITPLDVQFDTPSPSPPILGHLIPWNLLEAHGDSWGVGLPCLRKVAAVGGRGGRRGGKGDQASIIGGVIEFIKEMQLVLQSLESKKRRRSISPSPGPSPKPILQPETPQSERSIISHENVKELGASCNSPVADVEAKISGSNVILRTVSRRIPGQVVKIVNLLEKLALEILHLNISSMEDTVLYSFVIKIGLECQLSVEELAVEVQKSFSLNLT